MKLKTKFQDEDFELGEVTDADVATMPDGRIKLQAKAKDGGLHTIFYDKLEKLYSEWEDYEEPKVGYIIDPMEEDCVSEDDSGYEEADIERAKELGIWLETKEEAEKAVDKLKAWKRLKNKGLSFRHWKEAQLRPHSSCIAITGNMECDAEARKDLDLLFGGEK